MSSMLLKNTHYDATILDLLLMMIAEAMLSPYAERTYLK